MKLFYKIAAIFLCVFGVTNAQILKKQTLGVQGSSHFVYANTTSYYLRQSIGQGSVINSFNTEDYSLRQGFLQPVDASVLTSDLDNELKAAIYPNPFTTEINVQFGEVISDVLQVTMFDVLGRLVYEKEFSPNELITIYLDQFSSGHYMLRIQMRSQLLTAKLIRK
ncbi:MAG: T9SS type A sorting domain-containing protein [Winogradskyella sp.]|nr:T9SS type A sorting domain-containing protein [Winogradskyella sp.]